MKAAVSGYDSPRHGVRRRREGGDPELGSAQSAQHGALGHRTAGRFSTVPRRPTRLAEVTGCAGHLAGFREGTRRARTASLDRRQSVSTLADVAWLVPDEEHGDHRDEQRDPCDDLPADAPVPRLEHEPGRRRPQHADDRGARQDDRRRPRPIPAEPEDRDRLGGQQRRETDPHAADERVADVQLGRALRLARQPEAAGGA